MLKPQRAAAAEKVRGEPDRTAGTSSTTTTSRLGYQQAPRCAGRTLGLCPALSCGRGSRLG
eukprot:429911-Hanusia_phi.AAC.1